MKLWALAGILLPTAAHGDSADVVDEVLFADGVEICSTMDRGDYDRLSGCAELWIGTDPSDADTDDDGISDGDEVLGTTTGMFLPAMGVSPRHKDVLLEYDWFDDANDSDWPYAQTTCPSAHSHRPTPEILDHVTTAFANAPVPNPDGKNGIHVIHDFGQGGPFIGGQLVPDSDGNITGVVGGVEYDAIYAANFSAQRHGYFHYVLMPHRYVTSDGSSSSGYALYDSDKMMVSMYCYAHDTLAVARTIMHELGHNFGLHHGGTVDCNWKPNYVSIMNYRYQFSGVPVDCAGSQWTTAFSTGSRFPLNENSLDESSGMCGVPVDWNSNGAYTTGLVMDLNAYTGQFSDCAGQFTTLTDHDDWSALKVWAVAAGATMPDGVGCAAPPNDFELLKTRRTQR